MHVELGRRQDDVAFLFGRMRTTVSHACAVVEQERDDPLMEAEIGRIMAYRDAAKPELEPELEPAPEPEREVVLDHAA
jgi:hypothetical protein